MNSYALKSWAWGPETLAPAPPACVCAAHHAAGTVEYCLVCRTWTDSCAMCGTDVPEPEPARKPVQTAVCYDCLLPEIAAHLGGCDCDPFAERRAS
jgi:hypothetical protein